MVKVELIQRCIVDQYDGEQSDEFGNGEPLIREVVNIYGENGRIEDAENQAEALRIAYQGRASES
ncbi:hypothetical protein MASR1M31_21540 [Porphyromonadaceae bacterium]